MKTIQLNTNLVRGIFSGTYCTIWDTVDFEEYDDNNNLLEYGEDYEIDGKKHNKTIKECYQSNAKMVLDILVDDFGLTKIKNIKFGQMYSPKYYNFKNDELDLNLVVYKGFELQLLEKCLQLKDSESFNKYLNERYTSYDGFMSFTPNNIEDIKTALNNKTDKYEQSVGACLSYLLSSLQGDDNIEYSIYSNNGYECIYNAIKYLK